MLKLELLPFYLFLLFSLTGMITYAQKSEIELVTESSNFHSTEIEFSLGDYQLKPIITNNGIANLIQVEDAVPLLIKGAPDLPRFNTSILIPANSTTQIEIIDIQFVDIQSIEIAPSLGNYYRNEPLVSRSRTYSELYLNDEFFPSSAAELTSTFNFKGLNGIGISFQPFSYNVYSKILRVCSSIKIRVTNSISSNFNDDASKFTNSDLELFKHIFLNYPLNRSTDDIINQRLIVLSVPEFIPEITEFIDLKRKLGFEVEVINVQGFTQSNIKSQLQDLYLSNPFQYIVIIGDVEQVASPISYGGAGDPTYGYLLGNDAYPEAFVGRLSAENIPQLKTQLNRTIAYEKGIELVNLSNLAGIASEAGPGDDQEYDFEHLRNINSQLILSGYLNANEFFDGSQGGSDAVGNPTVNQVVESLNEGLGLLLYTGHGTDNSFTTSGYSNEDISALNNINAWPFICSVACLNGNFINGTCLGESFLRAEFNSHPSGAIAAYMSSINQSWSPPMSAQDEMANIIAGVYPELNNYSLGNICALSSLKMIQDYGEFGVEMAATWNLFGDPSLSLRTRFPHEIEATYLPSIQVNTATFEVICEVENAVVTLFQGDQLLGKGYITDGIVQINLNRLHSLDSLEITISAFNHIPFTGRVEIVPSENAFIAMNHTNFDDSLGNNNQQLDFSEHIYLHFELSNLGLMQSNSVQTQLSCSNPGIELLNFSCQLDSVPALQNLISSGCIEFRVNSLVEDLNPVQFELLIYEGNNLTFSSYINAEIRAPNLAVNSFEIEELTGNMNGRADPGETLLLKISNLNSGHSPSPNGLASISCDNCNVYFETQTTLVNSIGINSESFAIFQIAIPTDIILGMNIDFNYELLCDEYYLYQPITLKVGSQIEDAESHNFTSFPWNNTYVNPWNIDNTTYVDGYNSFKSGTILGGNSSELSIQFSNTVNDSISFHYKVSSELTWDLLRFYVDGSVVQTWSGEINWNRVSFPISAGAHELKWTYSKDNVVSSGLDAAWIDQIEFPMSAQFPTSINTLLYAEEFSFYPNPTNGMIQIVIPNNQVIRELQLLNLDGKLIVDYLPFNTQKLLLPANLSSGMYLLKINGYYHKLIYTAQ